MMNTAAITRIDRSSRLLAPAFLSIALIGCGSSGDSTPTTPTTPATPAPTTFSLTGRVTESAPSAFVAVSGATLSVADGPNAGRTATTNNNGDYQFTGLQGGGFTVSVTAPGYQATSAGINLTGNLTRSFSLDPTGPRTAFGPGQHRVGTSIAAGRYFSDPGSGCYWERQSGFSGTLSDVIANDFIGYNAMQYIVDILASDVAFDGDADCGNWYNTPRQPAQSGIPPGVWLVGAQLAPGLYEVNAGAGCYWERLRHFTHRGIDGVIANDFVADGGRRIVEVRSSDAGFLNDGDCGTWTRSSSLTGRAAASGTSDLVGMTKNREAHRARTGRTP
jgi:hypothetical protein